ncbi:hypothetical protein QFC21_002147 [Naganishia friedmannii]|uniref:Uncharacterized protein n=1 Tax=Naganishia friedmannii TaxID=89922 RepID=A0ACC2VYU9_9TREE|nr:hypothetical protein QFC21_002147 [Naganishia friedmannii]
MLPTLSHQGDFVLISPLPLRFHESGFQRAARGESSSSSSGILGWFRRRNTQTENAEYLSEEDTTWGIKRGDIIIATSPTDPSKTVCKRVIGLEGDVIEVDPTRSARRRQRRGRTRSWEGEGEDDREALSMAGKGTWEEADAQHRHVLSQRAPHPATPPIPTQTGEILVPVFPTIPPTAPNSLIPTRKRPETGVGHVRIPRGHVWLAGDNLSNSTDSRAYGPVAVGLLKGKVLARVWPNPKWITNETRYID